MGDFRYPTSDFWPLASGLWLLGKRLCPSLFLRLALFLAFLAGIPQLSAKPTVVVTTTLIASAVQDVAGDAFEIVTLMPA
ncbi:MAG: hypothetical protein WC378_19945, partial [Opitutaceae bacterium]